MKDDILVRVDGVSKKFCRGLKRSLWYGVQDVAGDIVGVDVSGGKLRREEFWALDDVSFEVPRGRCVGLIGRNGAGKTTLLKMLSGLIKPDRGRIEMRGRVGALIALGAGFNPVLTGRENIYINGSVLGLSKKEIQSKYQEIVDFADIGDFIDAPVQNYSSGMQVRLGFAIAASITPDILLLDEVLAVGDVRFQAKCFNTLSGFLKRGTGFILVSHNTHVISRYCDEVIYLGDGKVQHNGDVQTGIAKYLSDMEATGKEEAPDGSSWGEVLGSGKVKFVAARFLNAQDKEVSEIGVTDAVTLVIDYEKIAPQIDDVVLDVVIRKDGETMYHGTKEFSGAAFDGRGRKGRFAVRFDDVPINADRLEFFLTLLDAETSEVYDWKRHLPLKVRRDGGHQSPLVLRSAWSVLPEGNGSRAPRPANLVRDVAVLPG